MTAKKILIVDDDSLFTDTLFTLLGDKGYEVKTLYTGEEVLATIDSWKPDIILLDLMMPKKNGIEVLKDLSEKDSHLAKHVIVMTSMEGTTYLAQALEYGVKSYIAKTTVTPEYILEVVEAKAHELEESK